MLARAIALTLVPAALVAAAPVPAPSEKELLATHWGQTAGDGTFELTGHRLTLRTAGLPALGYIHRDRMNMPRAARTARGDFTATAKVLDALPPDTAVKADDGWPGTRAGLFASGGGYCLELHLYQFHTKQNNELSELKRVVWLDTWFPGGGSGSTRAQAPVGKSVWLRIARKGKDVTVSHSLDGTDWSAPLVPRQNLDFSDEVQVGVFLSHGTHQTGRATFEFLTVEKPK